MVNLKEVIDGYRVLKAMNEELLSCIDEFDEMAVEEAGDDSHNITEEKINQKINSGEVEIDKPSEFELSESMVDLLKKEYRAISKACHPDVEGSAILHRFFLSASNAHKEENIFEMIDISNTLFEKVNFLLSSNDKRVMINYITLEKGRIRNHRLWKWKSKPYEEKVSEVRKTLGILFSKK